MREFKENFDTNKKEPQDPEYKSNDVKAILN